VPLRVSGISNLQTVKLCQRVETGVFSRHFAAGRRIPTFFRCSAFAFIFLAILSRAVELRAAPGSAADRGAVSQAFAKYVHATDERNDLELKRATDLLWIDSLPEAARKKAYRELARGGIQLEQHNTVDSGREIFCPSCMIHHWEGLVFIPGARLDDVLRVLEDYNRHSEYYAPDVLQSRIDKHDGDHFRIFLRFRRQKVITVVLNTEHEVTYYRDSAIGAHSRSSATHVAEVDNPGKANEREKPREEDNGFLWGMETWWRMEEKDNGVYLQSEVVSLSRDLPAGLGWMIGPFVTAVPKESLTFTLEATRKAVLAQLGGRNSH
jgi:hypothetical protein